MENKRDIWSYDETMTLIHILKEKKILKIMDNKRFRIAEIFKSLEQEMKNKGYCRSATQIHIKFKGLKRTYNNCRTALSKSGAGVKKCMFYDELDELFGCRPINIQKGMDSLNATSSIDMDMFDNIPDADGAIPGCSKFSDNFNNSDINESENQFKSIDKSNITSLNVTDSIIRIEENSDLTIDKGVQQQLETPINDEIIDNNNDIATLLKNNTNKDSKKRVKSARSTNRQTFAQVFDGCVEKLIKSNEDITRIAIETQNKMINNILQQQEKMLQQQTQLLIQNLHANTLQSQVTTNYCPNPEQFRGPLQSFNNPRFVKVPLSVIQSSERCSPVIVTPPSTPTPPSFVPFSVSLPISTTSPTSSSITSPTSSSTTSATSYYFNSTSTSNQVTK
ncbi:putative uncharacterized protein DDB_G0282499 [Monomorium pharaonis]|uniref:putative uncharacterized protein DDB_G0282499 n=1 Tax=Monomorium pharaonis TaxID=307658 RepID=UPI00063F834C|nr:putative uncharacterized protein DDB_G0282499 [Monomorium pharaonis]